MALMKQTRIGSALTKQLCPALAIPVRYKKKEKESLLWYSKYKGFDTDFVLRMQQPLNFSAPGIEKWMKDRNWEKLKMSYSHQEEMEDELGSNIAAAHFVVARGGAIKFKDNEKWIEKNKDGEYHLPTTKVPGLFVEAIDCSNTSLMYESFDNFRNLRYCKYLKLSGCKYVDDYCMDKLTNVFENNLVHLDLSGCPAISERGLSVIYRLKNLRILELSNMTMIPSPGLISVMIEEALPKCKVIDVDYTNTEQEYIEKSNELPGFVANFDDIIKKKQEQYKDFFLGEKLT